MKELSFENMENLIGGGCNDKSDALAANIMCAGFFAMSFFPVTWGISIVGSAACVALGIGCATLM